MGGPQHSRRDDELPAETLENRLRSLANAGELTYLSVVPTAGKGQGGIVFSASYSPASKWGHDGHGRDADPVKAILAALDDENCKSITRKIKPNATPLVAVEPMKLTAAELKRAAGGPAPDPEPAMAAGEDEEPWLK